MSDLEYEIDDDDIGYGRRKSDSDSASGSARSSDDEGSSRRSSNHAAQGSQRQSSAAAFQSPQLQSSAPAFQQPRVSESDARSLKSQRSNISVRSISNPGIQLVPPGSRSRDFNNVEDNPTLVIPPAPPQMNSSQINISIQNRPPVPSQAVPLLRQQQDTPANVGAAGAAAAEAVPNRNQNSSNQAQGNSSGGAAGGGTRIQFDVPHSPSANSGFVASASANFSAAGTTLARTATRIGDAAMRFLGVHDDQHFGDSTIFQTVDEPDEPPILETAAQVTRNVSRTIRRAISVRDRGRDLEGQIPMAPIQNRNQNNVFTTPAVSTPPPATRPADTTTSPLPNTPPLSPPQAEDEYEFYSDDEEMPPAYEEVSLDQLDAGSAAGGANAAPITANVNLQGLAIRQGINQGLFQNSANQNGPLPPSVAYRQQMGLDNSNANVNANPNANRAARGGQRGRAPRNRGGANNNNNNNGRPPRRQDSGLYASDYPSYDPVSDPPALRDPKVRAQLAKRNKHRPIFLILVSVIQLIMMIYELYYNYAHYGSWIQMSPFNVMIGPGADTLVALGAKFAPCIINENVTVISASSVNSMNHTVNELEQFCGMGGFDGSQPDQWYRFFTASFVHSGVIQFLFDIMVQLRLGFQVERDLGFIRVAIIYLSSGVAGYVLSAMFDIYTPSAGSPANIIGLIAVMLVDLIQNWRVIKNPKRQLIWLIIVVLVTMALGLLPYIDNYSIIGGFIMGIITSIILVPSISFGSWDVKRKRIMVATAIPLYILLLGILLWAFYSGANAEGCTVCSYFDCVPFAPGWCSSNEV